MRSRKSFRTTYVVILTIETQLLRRKELERIVALLQEKIDASSIRYEFDEDFSEDNRLQLEVWFDVVVTLEKEPGLLLGALMRDLHALVARRLQHCTYEMEILCFPRASLGGLLLLEDGSYYPHSGTLARLVEIQPAVL